MDRRGFLIGAGAAGAALVMPGALSAQRGGRRAVRIDGLGGVNGFDPVDGAMVPSARLREAIRQGHVQAVSQTLGQVGNGPDRFQSAVEAIAQWDAIIARHGDILVKVERAADIRAAQAARKLGIIYNFQDTTALETEASRVELFKTLGLRVLQLTYNKRNLAGDGCLERSNGGISDFGREVIAKINAARLLLDLSHAGQRTIADGIAEAKAPPAITHSGCRDLVDVPRNTYDREIRALADKGGVIGIYFMPFLRQQGQATREDLLRHLDHAVNVGGEDHVGIGTDGPLLGLEINDETRARQRAFFEQRSKEGIAAPGEAADVFNIVTEYNDVERFDRLAADLRRRGWSSARVDKVLGGNFLRLYGEVWGG